MKTQSVNLEALNSPEYAGFKKHKDVVFAVPAHEAGYRGCIGLGMCVDGQSSDSWIEVREPTSTRLLVPDAGVRWASLVDVPPGFFRLSNEESVREVHWAALRPTTMKFGVPTLAADTETVAGDFRAMPGTPGATITPATPREFRLFNALNWAMTSTAFAFRRGWQPFADKFRRAVGLEERIAQRKALMFGSGVFDAVDRPGVWMPRAYIGFPAASREKLFHRSTRNHAAVIPMYSNSLQSEFCADLETGLGYVMPFDGVVASVSRAVYQDLPVLTITLVDEFGKTSVVRFGRHADVRCPVGVPVQAGTLVAREPIELPATWDAMSPAAKWDKFVLSAFRGMKFDSFLRVWFERKILDLASGLVHVPAALAAPAGFFGSIESSLYWDVSPGMDYFDESLEAFVFPTLQIKTWHALVGVLPGDVAYDFTPGDKRFLTPDQRRLLMERR